MSATFDHTMPKRMHQLYCALTGFDLPWDASRLWPWELWCLRFQESDLAIVIEFIKNQKRQGKPARSLVFRSLISGPSSLDFFAEDLSMAKALSRAPKPTPRNAILAATGRAEVKPDKVQSAAQILAGNEAFRKFIEFKNSL